MKNNIICDVMNFIRRDGPENAPVCFLTIEDGGSLLEHQFEEYINGNDHWIPETKDRPLTYSNSGLPGEFISKIMSGVFGNFNNWSEYRANNLYLKNENNIKFYPIGRKGTSTWDSWLEKKLNMSNSEYIVKCLAERHEIIYEKLNHILNIERTFVILGARDEWSFFLKKYAFGNADVKKELNPIHGYEFYYDKQGKLLFSYYPMFKRGARSSEALIMFCFELASKLPENLNKIVSI